MPIFRHCCGTLCGVVFAALCGGSAHAQCLRFSVDILPSQWCGFGYTTMTASGISELGELCGAGGTCGKFESPGFVWYGGPPIIYLPMPSGYWGGPKDMNSSRQMVGVMNNNEFGFYRVFFQENGMTTDIGNLPGDFESEAAGISEDGIVCATSYSPLGGSRVFVWQEGVTRVLAFPMGPYAVSDDISDTELVCGWMGEADTTVSHAFIHDLSTGHTTDIGVPLRSIMNTHATGVNSIGNLCGWGFEPCSPTCGKRRGFFWSDDAAQDVGMLPNMTRCVPSDLNDSDIVVGYCFSQNDSRAFIWQYGVMQDLNDLVPQELNLQIKIASAINNAGQIATEGYVLDGTEVKYVALRLTPIPPLVADLNCDWQVNSADLMEVIRNWGDCPPPPDDPTQAPPFAPPLCPADLNKDGRVSVPDLLEILNHWGDGQGLPK